MILSLSIISGQLIRIPIHTFPTVGAVSLLDIVVIIFCIFGLLKSKFRLRKPPKFITAAVIFILVAVISLIFTPLHLQFTEIGISLFYIIRFSLYILFAWLIYSGIFSNLTKQISNALMYSGIGLAILGLLQFIFLPDLGFLTNWGWDPHYFRTVSTFLDPNFVGAYFVLTLILFIHLRGVFLLTPRVFYIVFTIIYLALLTTFSRGAYLAFLISFGTLSILHRSARLGVITILLFSGLVLGFTSYQRLVAQPRGIDRVQSAEFRFSTWEQGWKLLKTHPVLGVGFNTYRYALKEYDLGNEQFLKSHGASTNDSSLLYVAVTTGILGFISYLFFLYSLFRSGSTILAAGLAGLTAQSFFANTLFYPPILLWIILMATYGEDKTSS